MTPRPGRAGPNADLPDGWRGQIVYPEGYRSAVEQLENPDPLEWGEAMDADAAEERRHWEEQNTNRTVKPLPDGCCGYTDADGACCTPMPPKNT